MNTKKYMKRLSGNLSFDEMNEDVSKTRTLDVEADLLMTFSRFLRDLERVKHLIDNPIPKYSPYGPGPMRRQKEEEPDMEKIKQIAYEKLDLVKEVIDDCFGGEEENSSVTKIRMKIPADNQEDYPDDEDYNDD